MTRKVHSTALEPGDRVLVRSLSEHGGPGKVQSHWEQDVYTVVKRQSESPVYIKEKEPPIISYTYTNTFRLGLSPVSQQSISV